VRCGQRHRTVAAGLPVGSLFGSLFGPLSGPLSDPRFGLGRANPLPQSLQYRHFIAVKVTTCFTRPAGVHVAPVSQRSSVRSSRPGP